MSTDGWLAEAPPLTLPDAPAPAEAGGVTTVPPPVTPPETPVLAPPVPVDTPAPVEAPPPTEPDVSAWASDMMDAQAIPRTIVFVIGLLQGVGRSPSTPGSRRRCERRPRWKWPHCGLSGAGLRRSWLTSRCGSLPNERAARAGVPE